MNSKTTWSTPLVLFSYFNPLLQYDIDKLARDARKAGIDGILVTDLTPEESKQFAAALKMNSLDMILLVARTSTDARLRISEHASGFVYAVSRAGVTGARENLSNEAELLVRRVRRFSSLPVAVGFGISNAEQVAKTFRYTDAAVGDWRLSRTSRSSQQAKTLCVKRGNSCVV